MSSSPLISTLALVLALVLWAGNVRDSEAGCCCCHCCKCCSCCTPCCNPPLLIKLPRTCPCCCKCCCPCCCCCGGGGGGRRRRDVRLLWKRAAVPFPQLNLPAPSGAPCACGSCASVGGKTRRDTVVMNLKDLLVPTPLKKTD